MDEDLEWFINEETSRFWSKVNKTDDCWLWTGAKNKDGYGNIRIAGRTMSVHRVSMMIRGREIPPGKEVDHLCRNRACVNPDHLEAVDHITNIRRGKIGVHMTLRRAQPYKCPNGHELTDDLVKLDRATNSRRCRICARKAVNKCAEKNREKARAYARNYYRKKRQARLESTC